MAERFFVSTGDIREQYETVNIVTCAANMEHLDDFGPTMKRAVDLLARAALEMGCNGVLWIRFQHVQNEAGYNSILASGTAVRVRVEDPPKSV